MRAGRHEAPRPKASKKKKALIITAVILLCVVGLYLFLVYTSNAFVAKWRTIYIETAMTTLSHKWLATAFLPAGVIQEVMDASAAMQAHDALIGGESSGGLTVRGHISGKDGLYAASLLVEMLSVTGKSMSQLIQELYARFGEMHTAQFDWALTPENRDRIHQTIMAEKRLPDFRRPIRQVSYRDGCKVYFDGAWVILRFSGTEPRVRIFAEDDTIHHAKTLVGIMADFVGLPFDA